MRKHGNQFKQPSPQQLEELENEKILFVHGAGFSRQVISAFALLSERPFIVLRCRPQESRSMSHFRKALTRASKKWGIKYGSRLLQHDREWAKVWNASTHIDTPPHRIYASHPHKSVTTEKIEVAQDGACSTLKSAELIVCAISWQRLPEV